LHSYDSNNELFSIVFSNGNIIDRNFQDLRHLLRNNKLEVVCGFPLKSFKHLMQSKSWTVNGNGWSPILSRSHNKSEQWINSSFKNLDIFHQNIFSDTTLSLEAQKSAKERRALEQRPRMLQQYFSSDKNISTLLILFDQYHSKVYDSNIIIIEPSCGDGRVLCQLMSHILEDERCRQEKIKCIGFDIDTEAVVNAKTNLNALSIPCSVHTADYLNISKEILFQSIEIDTNITPQQPIDKDSNSLPLFHHKIIVIGNPPYHNIFSDLENDEDIIVQFILHSAHCLGADVIIFILPTRCERESMVNHISSLLNYPCTLRMDRNEFIWQMVNCIPADNNFEICGRVVHQSAVIQVWEKILVTKG